VRLPQLCALPQGLGFGFVCWCVLVCAGVCWCVLAACGPPAASSSYTHYAPSLVLTCACRLSALCPCCCRPTQCPLKAFKTEAVAAYSRLHARTLPLAKDTVQFAWLMTLSAALSALKRGL
jgi:hypothetical protein